MHLILDLTSNRTANNRGANYNGEWPTEYGMTGANTEPSSTFQPSSVLSLSWIRRGRQKWATNYDANIAELDFDNVNTTEILALPTPQQPTATVHQTTSWTNDEENNVNEAYMKGSLELSSGESLFSSVAAPTDSEEVMKQLTEGTGVFISTDSLNVSSLDPDILLAACETKKHDYMLTFNNMDDSMSTLFDN